MVPLSGLLRFLPTCFRPAEPGERGLQLTAVGRRTGYSSVRGAEGVDRSRTGEAQPGRAPRAF